MKSCAFNCWPVLVMKRKFKQWLSSIPPISTEQRTFSFIYFIWVFVIPYVFPLSDQPSSYGMFLFCLICYSSLVLCDINDLTPVKGQEGKISDTQGKDFWSPTRPIEIFPANVWDFSVLPSFRCLILFLTNILLKVQYFPSRDTPYMKYDVTHILTSLKNDVKGTENDFSPLG